MKAVWVPEPKTRGQYVLRPLTLLLRKPPAVSRNEDSSVQKSLPKWLPDVRQAWLIEGTIVLNALCHQLLTRQ